MDYSSWVRVKCKWCRWGDTQHVEKDCLKLKANADAKNVRAMKMYHKAIGGKGKLCSYCASNTHETKLCHVKFDEIRNQLLRQKALAEPAFEYLKEIGFGEGCMLTGVTKKGWYTKTKQERVVIIEAFTAYTARHFFNELLCGDKRNWYLINAIDLEGERIRQIYLPKHSVYAPRPNSKKASVIVKAPPEETEKLKSYLSCYTNPIIAYSSVEAYVKVGGYSMVNYKKSVI